MVDGRKEGEKVEKDWNYSGLTQTQQSRLGPVYTRDLKAHPRDQSRLHVNST
jgi:hypothetical protein